MQPQKEFLIDPEAVDREEFSSGLSRLNDAFRKKFNRDIEITGEDTDVHKRLHGSGKARDIRTRNLSQGQIKFLIETAREIGFNLRDLSRVKGPTRTSTGITLTGPHLRLNYSKRLRPRDLAPPSSAQAPRSGEFFIDPNDSGIEDAPAPSASGPSAARAGAVASKVTAAAGDYLLDAGRVIERASGRRAPEIEDALAVARGAGLTDAQALDQVNEARRQAEASKEFVIDPDDAGISEIPGEAARDSEVSSGRAPRPIDAALIHHNTRIGFEVDRIMERARRAGFLNNLSEAEQKEYRKYIAGQLGRSKVKLPFSSKSPDDSPSERLADAEEKLADRLDGATDLMRSGLRVIRDMRRRQTLGPDADLEEAADGSDVEIVFDDGDEEDEEPDLSGEPGSQELAPESLTPESSAPEAPTPAPTPASHRRDSCGRSGD